MEENLNFSSGKPTAVRMNRSVNFLLNAGRSSLLLNSTRNTFILKRKWPPGFHKTNGNKNGLKGRNFVYEMVEYQSHRVQPDINVLLTASVEGIGEKGEVVSMRPSKAYNKVLLPGFGTYSDIKVDETKERLVSETFNAKRTANMLRNRVVGVVMNKDAPWTLEPWHIRVSLRKMGVYIREQDIKLPAEKITGPNLDLQNKEFEVEISVSDQEKATIKCRIHHWSTDVRERLPYVFEHWKQPGDSLFSAESITS